MEKKENYKKGIYWLIDLIINIIIILGLVLVIQKWVAAPFEVYGGSMCNTLNYIDETCVSTYGEKVLINEIKYLFSDPKRGDIVVFKTENEDEKKYYIKRVIATEGDEVEIKNGYVYLKKAETEEFIKLEEKYLSDENRGNTKPNIRNFDSFKVPKDHYFLLGDNRNSSTDSRSCFVTSISEECKENPEKAYVHESKIRGEASLVIWPIKQMRIIENIEI